MNANIKLTVTWFLLSATLFLNSSCHSTKGLQKEPGQNALRKSVEKSSIFNNGFTGFVLFDPASQKTIFSRFGDSYFTPASNTKILTLYTALKVLDNLIPGVKYLETTDGEIYIQGTGHPGLLNPAFPTEEDDVFHFLNTNTKPLTFCTCNFQDERYGSGWSWDDYYYYYMKEKSPLPLYGNSVSFSKPAREDTLAIIPTYFQNWCNLSADSTINIPLIYRNWNNNYYTLKLNNNSIFPNIERPFRSDPATVAALLSDTLHQRISLCNQNCAERKYTSIPSNIDPDALYTQLMQPSDNFVAEQLLLLCANQLFDTLSVQKTIDWALDSLFNQLIDSPMWVDGSGLSRYNLITPRSIVQVLSQLYTLYPEKRLFSIFPAGGESGTIKDWYGGLEQSYIFAKTGSLRHVHCLSGYIVTKKNRRLIFSFMHNNYTGDMRALKREMERVLQLIYAEF